MSTSTETDPAQQARPTTHRTSGLDLGTFDRSTRPQDDLFRFVNGGWVDATEIPPDRARFPAAILQHGHDGSGEPERRPS